MFAAGNWYQIADTFDLYPYDFYDFVGEQTFHKG